VERLENEHREFAPKLNRVVELANSGDLKVAESILNSLSQQILRHAVEEEARIIQVIADNTKPELERNAEVMRHHRRIEEFLKDKLPNLSELPWQGETGNQRFRDRTKETPQRRRNLFSPRFENIEINEFQKSV
jgi:hypothetical protein